MQIVSLSSLIKSGEESEVFDYLSSFSCVKNPGVEEFLKRNAIESEQRDFSRTSLVIDENNSNEIIGYFTLMNKLYEFGEDVSGTARKKIAFNKQAVSFSTILIAQLARGDQYKGIVAGKDILRLALENCRMIYNLIGMRIVCVEFEPTDVLQTFYFDNSFKILQANPNGYYLAFKKLS